MQAVQVCPWLCKVAHDSASFLKAVQVCPWLCKVAHDSASFLKAVQVCPWLCKISISVPMTVQAFLQLYRCARGYVRLV